MGVGALLPTNKAGMIGCEMVPIADGALIGTIHHRMGIGALLLANIAYMIGCYMVLMADSTSVRAIIRFMGAILPTNIAIEWHFEGGEIQNLK